MKRILLILTLVLALGIGTMAVFADSGKYDTRIPALNHQNITEQEREQWFNERNEYKDEYRKENLKDALKDGKITESQAKEWEEHYKYEDEFHNNNGYIGGGCGRGNSMMNGKGMMNGNRGMMRGNRY